MRYQWLSLKDVLRSLPAMDKKGVSKVARGKEDSTQTREGFVEAYIATNGSIDEMHKRLTGRNDHETWADRRNQFVARHLEQMRKGDTYSDGWLPSGEPTPRHLGLIAWAYSPSPKRLQKWLKTQPREWKQFVSNPLSEEQRKKLRELMLEEKRFRDHKRSLKIKKYSGDKGNNRHMTGFFEGYIDPKKAVNIFGYNQEHNKWDFKKGSCRGKGRHTEESWKKLADDVRENGIKTPIQIVVEYNKSLGVYQPFIWEGNHRARLACQLGVDLPVEVKYFGKAESVPLYSDHLSEHLSSTPFSSKKNPRDQIALDFRENDPFIPTIPKDVMLEIVHAITDAEAKQATVVIGNDEAPRNKNVQDAIRMGYLKVVSTTPHTLSGMTMYALKPTRKGYALNRKRREIIQSQQEQMSLFNNPSKSIIVPIHMISKAGIHEKVGEIKLSDSSKGLRIDTDLYNLPMGYHGTHIHEYGSLLPSKKGSKIIAGGQAGSHYDPDGAGFHGSPNGRGHRGDLPRINADEEGESKQTLYAPRLKLDELIGRSIIIHRYGDNYSDTPLPNGGGKERMAGGIITESCPHCRKNPVIRDGKGRKVAAKYYKGYTGKQLKQRIKEIEKRRDEYERAYDKYGDEQNFPQKLLDRIYRPFVTDKYVETKESKYTKEAHDRGFFGTWKEKARIASKYYGGRIDPKILHDVYRRGVGAWPTAHRGGATPQQWGNGRVNSFLVGGKTFLTKDNDLAQKLPEQVYENIMKERVQK